MSDAPHADPHDAVSWRREISDRQLETEKIVSAQGNTLSRIEQAIIDLSGAVKNIAQDQRFDRKPFQWSVAISFAGLVLMVAGSFSTLMLVPVRDQQAANTLHIAALNHSDLETAKWQGIAEGKWEERTKRLDGLIANVTAITDALCDGERRGAYTYGRMESALETLRDVDMAGSRKWVKPNTAAP